MLRYVERAAGEDAVRAIAERRGIEDAEAVMRYTGRWYSIAQTLRVANEAARVCGDSAIGRRTGEEHVLEACEQRGFREFVVALGTVPAAIELVLPPAQRMSGGRRFTVVEESDGRLVVDSQTLTSSGYPTFFCECVQGILASVPPILGYSWGPDPRHVPRDLDLTVSASVIEARLSTAEEIHDMAAELLRFHDINKLLSQICDAATASIEAPRFLLALRVGGSQTLRFHQRGFADDAVARTRALELECGRGRTAGDGALLANFAERGVEGFLAALSIAGAGYSSAEVRALDAYAGHAQAALNIVAVLARERSATATPLASFSHWQASSPVRPTLARWPTT